MYCSAVALATLCIVVVSGDLNCTKSGGCHPAPCGSLEVPVKGKPERDSFCRPLFTPTWQREKLRSCLCKRGYLRNSWDECIPRMKCFPCKFRWQRDYHTCMPACQKTCKTPFGSPCNKPCTAGCDCPPGYVVNPKFPSMCTQISNCHPKCPANSSFKWCVSNCPPKCGQIPPKTCDIKCNSEGGCVCNKGYAELERDGKKTCVLQKMCPLLSLNETKHTAEEKRLTDTPNNPGHVSKQSAVATSLVYTQNTSTSRGSSEQGAQPSATPAAGDLAVTVGTAGTLLPATSGTGGNLTSTTTEAGGNKLMSINAASTLSGPSSGNAGTSGAGGLAATVVTGGTLVPATSGTEGSPTPPATKTEGSKLVSINAASTLSGPSSGTAGTPGAGGLAATVGTGGTSVPTTSGTEGSLKPPATEAGGSTLASINATSPLSGPSSGPARTQAGRGLAVTIGTGGTLLSATSITEGTLTPPATEAGRSHPVSINATSTLRGLSSGAAATPGSGGVAVTVGTRGTLVAAASGTDGNLISSAIEAGRSELVSMNATNALSKLSSGAAGTPEAIVGATPTAAPAPALPTTVVSAPRSALPFIRHTDLGAATSPAQGSRSYSLSPLYTHSLRPALHSSANFGYHSWIPPFYGSSNYGLTSFGFKPWATPSPVAARHYVAGLRLYSWSTTLPGSLSYGWPGLGSYSWYSPLSYPWVF
uniref:TIL domain containing protein n=1 Tax=Rhipicephalus zambeziensis TaxID=60191 RepID=A0A224YPD9_9ACAR